MILDPQRLVIDMKSLSRGINTGSFSIPITGIDWNIEDVEPDDSEAVLDLSVDYEDGIVLCTGSLKAVFRTPCARCLAPSRFDITEDIDREYTWKTNSSAAKDDPVISATGELDIFDAVREAVLLSIPSKSLCSPDCPGICYN